MKLVKPSFQILEQKINKMPIPADMTIGPEMRKQELLNSVYRQIELAGRTCYKSEDKITEDSAKGFVERMVKSGHGAMLEHGTVYLKMPLVIEDYYDDIEADAYSIPIYSHDKYIRNPHSRVKIMEGQCHVTTSYRVLVENGWLDDLQYICEPTEYHEKRVTVKFVCDRGVSHEFVRHKLLCVA